MGRRLAWGLCWGGWLLCGLVGTTRLGLGWGLCILVLDSLSQHLLVGILLSPSLLILLARLSILLARLVLRMPWSRMLRIWLTLLRDLLLLAIWCRGVALRKTDTVLGDFGLLMLSRGKSLLMSWLSTSIGIAGLLSCLG